MDKMSINRYNYQEFFLLYTDNELKVAERKAVEDFVQQNPDLEEELLLLQHSILRPDAAIIFENKELLLQFNNLPNFIHPGNFETFAIDYADKELSDVDKARLEDFVSNNPDFQQEFNLIQNLKLAAEDTVTFPDKNLIYRYGKERKPVLFPWVQMAAASVILLFAGLLWLNNRPASYSPNLAQRAKPVPSKSLDIITKKPRKEKDNKLNNGISAFSGTAIAKGESVAISGKESIHANKNRMLPAKTSGRSVTRLERNNENQVLDNAANFIARVANNPESPKSAHISNNKSSAELANRLENIATIDASIEKTNKRIVDQPVVKINAINNNYTAAITVANAENDENMLLTPIDKKNPLRGILRKASRFIDKNTTSRTSKKSGLLIGNIEIAFQ